ncbi:PEP-CTERM sorting domain-containing protein [Alteromonas sp. K632G]|jgi:hypothetical protein|uniref:PEP-CTERM sorting domain-containing protein n=1 Tax=Alteromonas sp. K632G TaxID=2820757 RepID=UPI000C0E7B8F|nr:PEP-CTERM sorting domain-containing protein [Alteromonas sp. K632G]MBO7922649.1 PEP-CTERM sorting domain-containing protein [Alteromonas sp. K632G]PHS59400.1 MAG: hypothetical protein COB03_02955 [Alteromonas sp.]
MKLSMIKKGLAASVLLTGASFTANAGVVATSYLDVSLFGIVAYADLNNDGIVSFDDADRLSAEQIAASITITGGDRSVSTSTGFNGSGLANTGVFAAPNNEADGVFDCTGPSCATIGFSNNSVQNNYTDVAQLHSDSLTNGYSYAMADALVDGSAISSNADGFTYAAASVGSASNLASANSDIADALLSELDISISGLSELYLQFVSFYSLVVDVAQTADVDANSTLISNGTASALLTTSIGADATSATPGTVQIDFGSGFGYGSIPGQDTYSKDLVSVSDNFTGSDTGESTSSAFSETGFFLLSEGDYQVDINQISTARVSLVSAPAPLALFGLGLIGAAFARRRRS